MSVVWPVLAGVAVGWVIGTVSFIVGLHIFARKIKL